MQASMRWRCLFSWFFLSFFVGASCQFRGSWVCVALQMHELGIQSTVVCEKRCCEGCSASNEALEVAAPPPRTVRRCNEMCTPV